mmetsp:Transcript_26828/g.61865  ORF Transcript_26828/g.61865 Transcript_26828/m.61865 type:complete len:179 (+) Transcript_26828:57-593(+)
MRKPRSTRGRAALLAPLASLLVVVRGLAFVPQVSLWRLAQPNSKYCSSSCGVACRAAAAAKEEDIPQDAPDATAGKLVTRRKTLDEVLAATEPDEDTSGGSLARRDVYEEVGISEAEVAAYWDRREEAASATWDKVNFVAYPIFVILAIILLLSVADTIVNPQPEITSQDLEDALIGG